MTAAAPTPTGIVRARDPSRNGGGRLASSWHAVWSHRWFVLTLLLLGVLGAWQAARVLLGPEVVVDPVRRGSLIETVVASGNVQTP